MNTRRTCRALALNRRHYRAGCPARRLWLALHHWARFARREWRGDEWKRGRG